MPDAAGTPPVIATPETGVTSNGRVVIEAPKPRDDKGRFAAEEAAKADAPKAGASGASVASDASKPGTTDAAPDTATPAGETSKPKDPASRAYAAALEKEARATELAKAAKAEREAVKKERESYDAEYKPLREARQAVAKGDVLKAAELIGLDIEKLNEAYLGSLREPTDDERIGKAVEARLEAERKREQDAKAAEAKAAEERKSAEWQQSVSHYTGAITDYAQGLGDQLAERFDLCVAFEVDIDRVVQRAIQEAQTTGKVPTPEEALLLVENDLAARVGKSKKFKSPATNEDKTATTAEDNTPKTLTSRAAGEVPLRKDTNRAKSARERAAEAMRELGVE